MNKYLLTSVIAGTVLSLGFSPLAYATTTTATGTPATKPKVSYDITCVQNAVEKRETALIGGVDTLSTSLKAALTTRKDALKASWAITDAKERRAARKAAWDNYRTGAKNAHTALKTTRKSAWDTFETEMKSCKLTGFTDKENVDLSVPTGL